MNRSKSRFHLFLQMKNKATYKHKQSRASMKTAARKPVDSSLFVLMQCMAKCAVVLIYS